MSNPAVLIIAPFWKQPQHVGVLRIDRYVRWLAAAGFRSAVVHGASVDSVRETSSGLDIGVRDPAGVYREVSPPSAPTGLTGPTRRPNRTRSAIARTLLVPDVGALWARRASTRPAVLALAADARWILSSSPPESSHVAAYRLARATGRPLAVDLRDGWLDEPLRPILKNFAWRRWVEGRMERRILSAARCIFVTSQVWRDMLATRLPETAERIVVLTNGYPVSPPPVSARTPGRPRELVLMHGGRFTGSSGARSVEHLLEPLLAGIQGSGTAGVIRLIGDSDPRDSATARRFTERFEQAGWRIELKPPVARPQMLRQLREADGLLLLSASRAAIPSKLFEYLAVERPVLALAPTGSAVWRAMESVPQVSLVDYERSAEGIGSVRAFLQQCSAATLEHVAPHEYSEAWLSARFLEALFPSTPPVSAADSTPSNDPLANTAPHRGDR